jgi:hypothetical protein
MPWTWVGVIGKEYRDFIQGKATCRLHSKIQIYLILTPVGYLPVSGIGQILKKPKPVILVIF